MRSASRWQPPGEGTHHSLRGNAECQIERTRAPKASRECKVHEILWERVEACQDCCELWGVLSHGPDGIIVEG